MDEEIEVVAILSNSSGNESVGEMWLETKTFKISEPICNIFNWASEVKSRFSSTPQLIEKFIGNLRVTINQK